MVWRNCCISFRGKMSGTRTYSSTMQLFVLISKTLPPN